MTRGGVREVVSEDRTEQEHRESNTLMVIYTNQKDIPMSPREPSANAIVQEPHEVYFTLFSPTFAVLVLLLTLILTLP